MDKFRPVILIPQTAVSQDATGQYVMTVNNQGVVVQKYVTIGDVVGSQHIAVSGVEEGDRVVTIGQQKLQNGQQVNVSETNMPDEQRPVAASAQQAGKGNKCLPNSLLTARVLRW